MPTPNNSCFAGAMPGPITRLVLVLLLLTLSSAKVRRAICMPCYSHYTEPCFHKSCRAAARHREHAEFDMHSAAASSPGHKQIEAILRLLCDPFQC
jgi:hypothetical protein